MNISKTLQLKNLLSMHIFFTDFFKRFFWLILLISGIVEMVGHDRNHPDYKYGDAYEVKTIKDLRNVSFY